MKLTLYVKNVVFIYNKLETVSKSHTSRILGNNCKKKIRPFTVKIGKILFYLRLGVVKIQKMENRDIFLQPFLWNFNSLGVWIPWYPPLMQLTHSAVLTHLINVFTDQKNGYSHVSIFNFEQEHQCATQVVQVEERVWHLIRAFVHSVEQGVDVKKVIHF